MSFYQKIKQLEEKELFGRYLGVLGVVLTAYFLLCFIMAPEFATYYFSIFIFCFACNCFYARPDSPPDLLVYLLFGYGLFIILLLDILKEKHYHREISSEKIINNLLLE